MTRSKPNFSSYYESQEIDKVVDTAWDVILDWRRNDQPSSRTLCALFDALKILEPCFRERIWNEEGDAPA